VNALAAAGNAQTGIMASMIAQAGTKQTATPETPSDFTNLINLLLAPSTESQASAQDAPANQSGSQDEIASFTSPSSASFASFASAASLPPAPPAAQLAESLIRSMFTSSGFVSSGITASMPKKAASSSGSDPAQSAADTNMSTPPVVSPVLNALTQSRLMQSVDTSPVPVGAPVKGSVPASANGTVISAPVSKAAPSAPLAFALRLTPSEAVAQAPNSPAPNAQAPHAQAPNPQFPNFQTPRAQAPTIPDTEAATPKPAGEQASQPLPLESPAPVAAPEVAEAQPEAEKTPAETKQPSQPSEVKPKQETSVHESSAPAPVDAVANTAMNENANSFLNAQANPSPVQAAVKTQPAAGSSVPSPVEALRAAAPSAPAVAHAGSPIREIAVRIAPPQAPAVDVHLIERGGQINVAVRTPDGGLQTTLRQDLGSLVNSLERAGYRAEAFAPRDGVQQAAISTQTNSQNSREESQTGSGERGNAFGDSQQGGQQQQRQRDPRAAKWIEELEKQQ